jgi:lipopolysaccharide transport system ATP-binding protein
MSETLLKVDHVSKIYRTYRSNFARFARWFGAPMRASEEHHALTDVSFQLRRGETVALIGQNGAGKSTVLKIVVGTVRPTTGSVALNGRVSAILELGLGFNPEFTGRENVRHSGGLLGLDPAQLVELMPEIEQFAEIGDYIDQPVRTYSSGMSARLAFALATAVRPEILIVDEVLSVGDSYFQHKSFSRIRQFKEQGTSILLVTHSMGDVRELCDRVLLFDKGRLVKEGLADEVVDFYNAMIADRENSKQTIEQKRQENGWLVSRSGDFRAVVETMKLVDAATNAPVQTALIGQQLALLVQVKAKTDLERLVFGIMFRDRTGHVIWGTNTWHTEQVLTDVSAEALVEYRVYFSCLFGAGTYSISPALVSSSTHLTDNYEWTDNLIVFDVVNASYPFFIGSSHLEAKIEIVHPSVTEDV